MLLNSTCALSIQSRSRLTRLVEDTFTALLLLQPYHFIGIMCIVSSLAVYNHEMCFLDYTLYTVFLLIFFLRLYAYIPRFTDILLHVTTFINHSIITHSNKRLRGAADWKSWLNIWIPYFLSRLMTAAMTTLFNDNVISLSLYVNPAESSVSITQSKLVTENFNLLFVEKLTA